MIQNLSLSLVSCDDYILDKEVLTFNVMAPLEVQDGQWEEFEKQLTVAKSMGVNGVSVDVWWGKVEGEADNSFDWTYYDKIFDLITDAGLKVIPIMSFHQCGGNVGDNVTIPIPSWVWTSIEGKTFKGIEMTKEDAMYISEKGNADPEVVALWADKLVANQYLEFMNAFEDHFADYAEEFIEINVSLGPSGELRYPSYQLDNGDPDVPNDAWSFPHRGYLQSYSQLAIKDFQRSMLRKYRGLAGVNEAWGSSYASKDEILPPQDNDVFFADDNYMEGQYAKDFVDWYNQELVDHGELMIDLAQKAFDGALDRSILGVKMPGIHWQINSSAELCDASRSAETTVGIIASDRSAENGYGYNPILDLIASYEDVVLHFTCLEMNEKYTPDFWNNTGQTSMSKTLVNWVGEAAAAKGVILKGENALNRHNDSQHIWINIDDAISSGNYYGLTFLRIEDIAYGTSYDHYKELIAKFTENEQTELLAEINGLTIHFKPDVPLGIDEYYMWTWGGYGINADYGLAGVNGPSELEVETDHEGWHVLEMAVFPEVQEFGFKAEASAELLFCDDQGDGWYGNYVYRLVDHGTEIWIDHSTGSISTTAPDNY
jgi:beta-amylase